MKVMIIGADGQLGTDLNQHFQKNHDVIPLTQEDIEISDFDSVQTVLRKHNPDVVINTAAFHKVELCEEEPNLSWEVNALGPKYHAKTCQDISAKCVHISTDYVFDGLKQSPYTEEDLPRPLNVYANTKLAGEYFVSQETDNYIVARVSGIYGRARCMAKGGNFINTMLRLYREGKHLRVVEDEILTPTSTVEIARQLDKMIEKDATGLFHVTQEGQCSWHAFASAIFEILGIDIDIEPVTVDTFPSTIKRPHYSVLENKHLKELNINIMQDWKSALKEFLTQTPLEDL